MIYIQCFTEFTEHSEECIFSLFDDIYIELQFLTGEERGQGFQNVL